MTYVAAEPADSLVSQMPSNTQKLACPEAVYVSYLPSADEAAFSSASLWGKLQEKRANAQLLYDSFAQPAAVGTRSIAMRVRQMLFRAEPYQVDLQVEAQPDRKRLVVTGQLIDVGQPDRLDASIEITLSDGRGNTISTVTNRFGEFRSEVILSGDLDLSFVSRDGKPIVILVRGTLEPGLMGKN